MTSGDETAAEGNNGLSGEKNAGFKHGVFEVLKSIKSRMANAVYRYERLP